MVTAQPVPPKTTNNLATLIDHTKLTFQPGENPSTAITQLCTEAKAHHCYAVCIPLAWVPTAKTLLQCTSIKIATVIGFPVEKTTLAAQQQTLTIGRSSTSAKVAEVKQAVAAGVDELDVVLNVAQFKTDCAHSTPTDWSNTDWQATPTGQEITALKQAANGCPIKLIVETDLLTAEEVVAAVHLCHQQQLLMIKTSTGMITNGQNATTTNVGLIKNTIDNLKSPLKIKASGGIRDQEKALSLVAAGANRLGTSATLTLLK